MKLHKLNNEGWVGVEIFQNLVNVGSLSKELKFRELLIFVIYLKQGQGGGRGCSYQQNISYLNCLRTRYGMKNVIIKVGRDGAGWKFSACSVKEVITESKKYNVLSKDILGVEN